MNKAVAEAFQIFCGKEIKPDDWLWCRRCHRCYKASEFRKSIDKGQIFLFCHYRDCNGDLPLDSIPWCKFMTDSFGIPKVPSKGKRYDLRISPPDRALIGMFEGASLEENVDWQS